MRSQFSTASPPVHNPNSAFERIFAAAEEHGLRPRRHGRYFLMLCPLHDDREPSCSVLDLTGKRKVKITCFLCGKDADVSILAALGLPISAVYDEPKGTCTGFQPVRLLAPRSSVRKPQITVRRPPAIVLERYDYVDEYGRLLFVKERLDGKPKFRQFVPTTTGKKWDLNGTRRVLFNLPQVIEAIAFGELVYLCEGEKDSNAMTMAGVTSTTWTEGAWGPGSTPKWRDEYTSMLRDAWVVVVRDRDVAGMATAWDIARELRPVAAGVWVTRPAYGKDASDHLSAGFGVDDFIAETLGDDL
jgi:hypothetical protein